MSQRHAKDAPRDIEAPLPDDPIFAAFGIEPDQAERTQALARPPRRLWRSVIVAGLAVVALAAGSLFLRPSHMTAHAETPAAPVGSGASTPAPAASAFNDAMSKAMMNMHMAMDVPYSGDADRDFARMMIPHHQGAIDMAQLELQYGKDPRLRRLAEEIIVTQQQEIAVMQLVLKDLAANQPAPIPPSSATPPANGMQMNGMQMNNAPAPGSSATSATP